MSQLGMTGGVSLASAGIDLCFYLEKRLESAVDAARDWATRTDLIVSEIKILKERLG